jgi:NADPH2:quinone reductase
MKAIAIQTFGAPEGLAVVELPDPVPATGQVLINVEAIGVGGVDALIRSGVLAAYGFQPGYVPGNEVAGTVTAVGDGVAPEWLGRRVWAFTGAGGYVEQVVASLADVVPLPADLSTVDSVAIGNSGLVAHFGLARAHFAPGESVLVRGAAGSIGIMAVQLAARGGASVAVTTSSPERGKRLRELGATHVLDRSGGSGGGWDVIMAAFQRSISFATFSADTVSAEDRRPVWTDQFAAAGRGELVAVVHEVLPLGLAALAHRRMDNGEVFGRIVLTP